MTEVRRLLRLLSVRRTVDKEIINGGDWRERAVFWYLVAATTVSIVVGVIFMPGWGVYVESRK